jgi:serine/threonine-protein kinase
MATAPAPDLKTLGRYNLERVLGKGAMGVVYEGVDPRLGRRVAIKTILKSHLDEDTAKDYSMRFVREAQAVARLNHPNVVQVFDFGEEGDIAYLVMEFIKGKELKTFFDANERFDLKEAVRIMGELCDALDFAHNAGIIHRDIKPANVMLDAQARTKLTDFGVARVQDSDKTSVERTQAGTMVGTPAYMSPEQITGGNIDKRTDVFSAGIILYQFLTGEKPFTGSGAWTIAKKIIQEEPPLPSSLNNAITPLFDAVVNKALSKNPDTRFQSARDLGVALKRALEGKGIEDDSDKTVAGAMTGEFAALARPAPAVARASPQESQRTAGTATQAGGNQEVELEFWRAIKDGNDPDDFELYVQQFPTGIYSALAKRKIAKLRGVPLEESSAKAKEQEKKELEDAARRETEAKSKLEAEKARLEAEMAKREEEYKRREAEAQARAEKARQEAEALAAKAKQEAVAELERREAEFKKREAEAQAKLGMDAKARAEAEEKARKEAVEKAKQEAAAEMARKEAEYNKREAEAEAKRQAAEKTRAEAEAKARTEADAKAKADAAARAKQAAEDKAKRDAELKARAEQEAKQKAEFAKREADLKKRVDEAESKPGGKKAAVKVAIIGIGIVAAVAAGVIAILPKEDPEAAAKLQAMQKQLEEAKKRTQELEAAKQKEEQARIALEKARAAEAEAKKSGDLAKQKELAEARIRAEAEAKKQSEVTKAAEQQKVAAEKSASDARTRAEAKKAEETSAQSARAAAERAAAERAAGDKLAQEKAALDAERARIATEKLEAEKLAAEARAAQEKAKQAQAAQSSGAAGTASQYQVAASLEGEGKGKEAVKAYTQAARGGNCEAAKRLGDIYDKGLIGITRDYAESLKWYNAARVLGCDVPLQQRRG